MSSQGPLPTEDFTRVFRDHPGGVCVVTADAGSGPVAMTVTSVASVSVDPPLLVFSVSDASSSAPVLTSAATVVVHFLGEEGLPVAKLGATSGIDRFADRDAWTRLPGGEPLYHGARAWIRGRVTERLRAGTATLTVVEALQSGSTAQATGEDAPLVYHHRSWHRLSEGSLLSAPQAI
ncbi:flavin reductase family protein [Sediminivirga luteola]|uniref:Monooxygenase n=1 Tax=Sediminivirga luteola TaxID=1774748 RepID=A0A8J2XKU9_9MICO|nr:flavin reductase family protein [Sediminivirga luteola]MCI2264210.1 flavin reductase family protein [Sediminivirga luteola]GGA17326.1 monooxygenase [Sediminivirga luteola]